MGMIYLNHMGNRELAKAMFAKSLALNENQSDLTMLMVGQGPEIRELGLPGHGVGLPVPEPPLPELPELPGQ